MPRLRKLCLTHFAGLGPVSAATTAYFRELNTVEHLHLTDTAGAFILPVTTAAAVSRRRSITFLSEMESTARSSRGRHKRFDMNNDTSFTDPSIFPNLHTVSLNTFRAADVAWLCNFVVSRESSISTVRLSPSAMRHLEGSLRKRGDHIETARLLVVGLRDRELENMLPRDMDRWLRSRVKVEPEDTTGIYQSRQSFTPNSI
ncbi:hypothetical protein BD626DRAFT_550588 [Schizophyllum amplum]|uniref:Uncharacterized protein n=1 Tax=Schizophyllum amplum TaxID=97359 RepID=A0A550C1Y6_9AGAR|nr:hypothetical protein BD626DRAFT_550588 [Auriculariopsis ampla]